MIVREGKGAPSKGKKGKEKERKETKKKMGGEEYGTKRGVKD